MWAQHQPSSISSLVRTLESQQLQVLSDELERQTLSSSIDTLKRKYRFGHGLTLYTAATVPSIR